MARTARATHDTCYILVEWISDTEKLVAYFDDAREAEDAYNLAGIPSKLFRVLKECK